MAKEGTTGSHAERLAEARAFIECEFRRSPTLNEIAGAAHASPFHFHQLFRLASVLRAGLLPAPFCLPLRRGSGNAYRSRGLGGRVRCK